MESERLPLSRSDGMALRSWVLVGGLVILMCAAFVVLTRGRVTTAGSELGRDKACFVVVNAVTLTGFQIATNPEDYKGLGQAVVFTLSIAGTLVTLIVGGWALVRIVGYPISDEQVVFGTLFTFTLASLVGAIALIDRTSGLWGPIAAASSAFGNFGLGAARLPAWSEWRLQIIILPLAALGGLSIPVLIDLSQCILHARRPQSHSGIALASTAAVFLIGVAAISMIESAETGVLSAWMENPTQRLDASMRTRFENSVTAGAIEAVNARSLGAGTGALGNLSRGSLWVVMAMVAIGASPAGAGGGIKGTTLYVILRDMLRLIRGKPASRMLGFALLWCLAFAVVAALTLLALLVCEPQMLPERAVFVALSAVSNAGLSPEAVVVSSSSYLWLAGAMLVGRFAPLAMLVWMATRIKDADVAVV